jgi:hypothetical protein
VGSWRARYGGRVAAKGSRFPPFDPIREAGARCLKVRRDRARPRSRRSPRALRRGNAGGSYGGSVLCCMLGFGARASTVEWPPTGHGSPRSIRYARLMLKRIAPFRTGLFIATFRCDAPARCGTLVVSGASLYSTETDGRLPRAMSRTTVARRSFRTVLGTTQA